MIELNEKNYYDTIGSTEGASVVQYTANWCGPCKMLTPRLQSMEEAGHFTYYRVDVDQNPELVREFRIMSVPTVFVYRDGQKVNQFVGAKSESEILDKLRGA